ncbi:MAG: hypothetical protein AUK48_00585 [Oscillatoriales cyanobacterium CG2_30_44_21]|nr:MAG: hypothetical protein AUK48_00585 [Oscillatoriales cyanobacterium CG2_30_44_21]
MKRISSKDEDLITKVSLPLGDKVSSLKVRRSLAILGFALSAGTAGILLNQQSTSNSPTVTPVAASSLTLTDVMSQNQERKYEMARMAIASGSWENVQGVVIHEVREDETLWKLTQVYQVDAAAIASSNGITAGTELQAGMKLMIPPVNGLVHRVKSGDTLEAISAYYNVPKSEIIKFTSLTSGDFLAIDQPLVIPGNVSNLMQVKEGHVKRQLLAEKERLEKRLQELEGKKVKATLATAKVTNDENAIAKQPKYAAYKVQNGDTIETIARRYGVTQKSIIEANKLENPQWLELNQELKLPQSQPLGSVQTVAASLNQKPLKQVPSPSGDLSGNSLGNPANILDEQVRVAAATPMVLPKELVTKLAAASRVSPWDGLLQLTGSESQPVSSSLAQRVSVAAQPNSAPSIDPVAKLATSLLPFAPDQLLGNVAGESAKNGRSATAFNINLPARSLATPAVPALTASEQFSDSRAIPIEAGSSQPVAEPRVQLPVRIAAVLSVPQIPRTLLNEQKVDLQGAPAENANQPTLEPTANPATVAAVVVPRIPSNPSVEQNSTSNPVPASPSAQPALEPNVQIPARLAASLAPKIPSAESVDQPANSSSNAQVEKVALLPDPEARMSSLEVKRLESEVDQLNSKVREAEIREAARRVEEARKLEAAKIAAANLNASSNPDRDFDASRSAIANPGDRSGIEPQLPQLMASAYLPDVQDYGLSTGFIWPADGVFTSGYGWRWGRIHQGVDIAAPVGTPILAAASGVVEYSSWNDGGYGNMIDIRHADGTITRYAHMSDLYVKEGQTVSQGQLIGAMGSTGFSTGPHLHFEIRPNGGSAIDPMVFLAKASN